MPKLAPSILPLALALIAGPAFGEQEKLKKQGDLTCEQPKRKKAQRKKKRELHLAGECSPETMHTFYDANIFLLQYQTQIRSQFEEICELSELDCPSSEEIDQVFAHLPEVELECGTELLLDPECNWATGDDDEDVTVAFTLLTRKGPEQPGQYWLSSAFQNSTVCEMADTNLHEFIHVILNKSHEGLIYQENDWIYLIGEIASAECLGLPTSPQIATRHPSPGEGLLASQ